MTSNSLLGRRVLSRLCALAIVGSMLGACAEARFVVHTAKRLGETNKSQGNYKVGKPYKIKGIQYTPKEDWGYNRTGIASWYGPNFDGKPTANGEVFDQWAVSAAHKTLPMPSMVRVTNLENGRSLVVRVNDRGPFVGTRIIDMSRRAAELLGFDKKGTARVRVQILPKESKAIAQNARVSGVQLASNESPIQSASVATESVAIKKLPAPLLARPAAVEIVPISQAPITEAVVAPVNIAVANVGDLAQVPVSPTRMFIQAGAFSDKLNAQRVRDRLSAIGVVSVTSYPVNGRELFRVRLGPISNVMDADRLLAEVVQAGYNTARTVVENTQP